jgi:hypothetical protein
MQRSVISGICLLIILVLFSIEAVWSITAQNEFRPCAPLAGFELINYGRKWNAWSNGSRSVYLEGFVDGQSHTYVLLQDDLPAQRREPLRLQTFTFYENGTLRDVITSLYSDPANAYVTHSSMVYIARDKLGGKDIEVMLRNARQKDCGHTETRR